MKDLTNLEILETVSINHKKLKEAKPLLFHNILKAMDKAKSQAINYTHSCKSDSEQLFCYHEGSYTLNEDGTCCKCHRLPKPKAK
tara:strand:- start:409 stop:663 length:255 start_codon:yes stop_codon:yes gene_type:complete